MKENKNLGHLIAHASLLFRRHFDNLVAAESREYTDSLSGRNMWVLRYLSEHRDENVFQKDLENAFGIRRSTVSKTVELMEQKGLVLRESVNGDARLKRLRLTDKAELILEAVSRGVDRMEEDIKNAFPPQDHDRLTTLLGQLCDILDSVERPDSEGDRDLCRKGKEGSDKV